MAEAKKLVIFGDSIAKGVMFQDGRYHLCRGHDFDALAQQGVEVRNFAKMGACTDTGLAIAKKRLESCRDAQVLLFFGGNDCDFDWQAVSDHPDGVHLPKIPAEQFLENYRALMDLVRQTASRVWLSSLVPLEAHRFLDHVSQGRSRENILTWLGDTDHIFRWQEYYNDLVCKLAWELSCPLLELRPEFLKDPAFPALLSMDGIHPTQKGHDVIHRCVAEAIF